MKVLIACEFSGVVREAFAQRGHDALSCDLLPTEIPGQHIQGDVLDLLDEGWDLMIAHPPCTYLSYAGNHVWNKPGRAEKREEAMQFFLSLYNAPIEQICVENPVGYPNTVFRKPDQIIHPFHFGEPYKKRTCLWLKNLPILEHGNEVEATPLYYRKTGKATGKKIHYTEGIHGNKCRSRTFTGIANAMVEQWGNPRRRPPASAGGDVSRADSGYSWHISASHLR